MFRPLIIKERRSELKCYGALFTCFSSCSVHIEVTNFLDADSFILALRRFMAKRGTVCSIWSDNETNFVDTRNELQQALKYMKHDKIKSFLQGNGADMILWHNNPPGASHMGGVWECQIRSARTILEGLLKTHSHSLNDESLRTLMAEVELIINLRPLTVETIGDSKREILLSPSNLLTMKTTVVMLRPGEFKKPDAYSKRRWQHVQHIAGEFWSRWRKEFLQSLQVRVFAVDIILLKDDCHQNQCPMARIVGIDADAKNDVQSVTLQVANKKGGPDSPTGGAISKLTK